MSWTCTDGHCQHLAFCWSEVAVKTVEKVDVHLEVGKGHRLRFLFSDSHFRATLDEQSFIDVDYLGIKTPLLSEVDSGDARVVVWLFRRHHDAEEEADLHWSEGYKCVRRDFGHFTFLMPSYLFIDGEPDYGHCIFTGALQREKDIVYDRP